VKKISTMVFNLLILSAFIGLAACGGAAPQTPTQITVDMHEFMFNPQTVTVPAGAQVELTLINSGALEHEWVIMNQGVQVTPPFSDDDEANIYWEMEVPPGQTMTGDFTAPSEPGEYQVICGIAGHMEAGMVGTLRVTGN
jgi:uncharacterized cupredoxin-like copper-binding protein